MTLTRFRPVHPTHARRCLRPSVWTATGCEEAGVRPTTTVQSSDTADQVLEGFSHYVTNEGIRRSRVEADTAFFYEATQVTELHNVKVVFFDIKGAESSTLTAQTGHLSLAGWLDGGHRQRRGGVTRWAPARHPDRCAMTTRPTPFLTDKHFTFDRGEEHLEGNSFRSDPDFKNVVTDRPRGVSGNGMLLPGQ